MSVSQMPAHGRFRVERPVVLLTIRRLPQSCRPCRMVRENDMTLIAMHPGTPIFDVVEWMTRPNHCTEFELNVIREAFGQPPVGQPLSPDGLDGYVGEYALPASLCLSGERRAEDEPA